MSGFSDREKAFEKKFEHDQDLRFRVQVRRNKLLGLWVGSELFGMSAPEADAYSKEVISSDLEEPGDDDVVRKVMSDIKARDIDFSEHRLRKQMAEFLNAAKQQIMKS